MSEEERGLVEIQELLEERLPRRRQVVADAVPPLLGRCRQPRDLGIVEETLPRSCRLIPLRQVFT